MKTTKVIYKIFTVADYDREEKYLRNMHQRGWKLLKVSYSPFIVAVRYSFESCQPQDMIYQLDFQPLKKKEGPAYFQLFEDFGWEHIQRFNDFAYFRKPASDIEKDEEFEIYNDTASKLEMIQRIVSWRFIPATIVLGVTLCYQWFNGISRYPILFAIFFMVWFILLSQLVHISISLWKKRKILKDEEK